MAGPVENVACAAEFDDLAQIHDSDAVGNVAHDLNVVRNEQVCQSEVPLQVHEQVEDLRLHGHIERRGRLIEDDELRIEGQCAGNRDALALSA